MKYKSEIITLKTLGPYDLIDITVRVREFVRFTGVMNGLIQVSSMHTTASVRVNEKCDELKKDLFSFLEKLAPSEGKYAHNVIAIDGRPNAHSHLLSFLVPHAETLVIKDGEIGLGSWQSVFFLELDGPRKERQVQIYCMGE